MDCLIPKFISKNKSIRLNQTYIRPVHPEFELNIVKVYHRWFLENYFHHDLENIENYLAYKFQKKRGYSEGLIPYLKDIENAGRIIIDKIKRLHFGSLYMEGYNLIVWRPL